MPYLGTASFLPVDSVIRHWAAFNHCNLTPVITQVPNINLVDGCTAERQVFSGGDNGSTVELYKIIGGAHTWPGAPFVIGVTNMDINASLEIWKFFRKYRMNLLTSAYPENEKQKISLFPNPSNGNFTVRFGDNTPKTVSVINSLGQEIEHFETSSNEISLKIEGKGIYFVRVDGAVMKIAVE